VPAATPQTQQPADPGTAPESPAPLPKDQPQPEAEQPKTFKIDQNAAPAQESEPTVPQESDGATGPIAPEPSEPAAGTAEPEETGSDQAPALPAAGEALTEETLQPSTEQTPPADKQ
jgi:hypothetical protein